jgi:DNA-directed RNA polymerase specialized sigma24 family protein
VSEKSPTTLADLLAALPEEERFILTLHIIKGRSPSDIAQALGVPLRAVESVIAVGKARIMGVISKN